MISVVSFHLGKAQNIRNSFGRISSSMWLYVCVRESDRNDNDDDDDDGSGGGGRINWYWYLVRYEPSDRDRKKANE